MSEYQTNTLAVAHKRATTTTIVYRLIYLVEVGSTKILHRVERTRSDIAIYQEDYVVGSVYGSNTWNAAEYREMLIAIETAQNNNIDLVFKPDACVISLDEWLLESVDSFVERAERYLMIDRL